MLKFQWMAGRFALAALSAVVSACSAITFGIANAPALFGPYERTTAIAYGPDKRQRLDVYVPAPDATKETAHGKPVVIFWYGGAWQGGSRSEYRFVGAALARRGIVTVLPDYRLYPQVKFPEFLDDAAHAVAWVQQHAQEFGGDPHRIVLMGHSAGAHMAAFLALDRALLEKNGAKPDWIAGLVGLSGPYALVPNSKVLETIFARPYSESDWQPVSFVTPQAPPTFLAQGLADRVVALAHTEKLRDLLVANGVRVETHLYPGRSHEDTVAGFSVPARGRLPVFEQAVQFIESVAPRSDPSR